jgi:hypothetical protein
MDKEIYLGDLPLWADEDAYAILLESCKKHNVDAELFAELVALQRKYENMERARGIYEDFDYVFERMD